MDKSKEEEHIREIHQDLLDVYGEAPEPSNQSGVDYLVETILSQNTNDINRDKAFKQMKEDFEDYEEIMNADPERLEDSIRVAGLGATKAERIQGALKILMEERGEFELEFINDMSIDEGKKWLTDIPGIGPKTAAIILCFHFGKPVIPVDTHVHRVSKRFGLIPENASRSKAHDILEEKIPDDIKYSFHRLLITHGRENCKARNPTCGETKLKKYCKHYEKVIIGDKDPEEVV